jgi:hypothetical protein
VFKGPVRSGFLAPKGATVNRNRLRLHPSVQTTGPNHKGPVQIGPVVVHQPVSTGLKEDQLKPVVNGFTGSPDWSFYVQYNIYSAKVLILITTNDNFDHSSFGCDTAVRDVAPRLLNT